MNKKTLYITIGILVLIIAVGGFFFLTNKIQNNQEVYTNPVYGYSINIPADWKDKYLVEEKDNVTSFLFHLSPTSASKYPIFSITAYPTNDWEQVKQEPGYHGTEITSRDNFVFVYAISLDNPFMGSEGNEYQKMAKDVNEIIKTFKINGGQKTMRSSNQQVQTSANEGTMVDCGVLKEPTCFFNRMNNCQPVKAKLTGNDGSSIEIAILGIENEKCHFQRKVNDILNLNCYFPKGTLNPDTLDQTFGNDKGAEAKKIVDEACKPAGW